jgi:2-oxoacid:acceptor oxidoreductase gamma subunit (pyruvate/2-ketoisovalerate family)
VVSFLRVDKEKILLKCGIKHPSEMVYLDDTLVDAQEVNSLLTAGGKMIVNTNRPPSVFKSLQSITIGLIDARSIAEELGLGRTINTAVLGAYCRISEKPSLEVLLASIQEMVPAKKAANLEAARQAYERLETC